MRKLILSLFVLAGGSLLAQQQWVPLGSSGVVGVVAPDSPLPPLVITPYGQYPPRLHQCENGAFHARPDTPVAELDHADAATYTCADSCEPSQLMRCSQRAGVTTWSRRCDNRGCRPRRLWRGRCSRNRRPGPDPRRGGMTILRSCPFESRVVYAVQHGFAHHPVHR
jgi:hypothetical protein